MGSIPAVDVLCVALLLGGIAYYGGYGGAQFALRGLRRALAELADDFDSLSRRVAKREGAEGRATRLATEPKPAEVSNLAARLKAQLEKKQKQQQQPSLVQGEPSQDDLAAARRVLEASAKGA